MKYYKTGWREAGQNGYIWSFSTPTIRYDEYHHSRGGEMVKQVIGEDFQGVLGSDFYAGYNMHQGCISGAGSTSSAISMILNVWCEILWVVYHSSNSAIIA